MPKKKPTSMQRAQAIAGQLQAGLKVDAVHVINTKRTAERYGTVVPQRHQVRFLLRWREFELSVPIARKVLFSKRHDHADTVLTTVRDMWVLYLQTHLQEKLATNFFGGVPYGHTAPRS